MNGYLSKVKYILKDEGVSSLAKRSFNYGVVKAKRFAMDKQPVLQDWQQLKGAYDGERVFLVGNGPSLNQTPLYLLKDEYTMCFNRFDLMLERLDWIPTFYAVTDDLVLRDTLPEVNAMARKVEHAFFPDIHISNIDFRKLIEPNPSIHWLFLDRIGFSDDLPYCGINKTVANVGLQVLAHLGFKEIYLIGVDMSYSAPKSDTMLNKRDVLSDGDDENHFDPRYFGKGRKYHVPKMDETLQKYIDARNFFEHRGVTIRNATVGGKLEVFERVKFSEVVSFDQREARARFTDCIQRNLSVGMSIDAVLQSDVLEDPSHVGAGRDAFVARASRVGKFITALIDTYVPFGPYEDVYVFVSRRCLNEH